MPTLELPLQHPSLRAVFGAKGILPWGEGVSSSLAEATARWCGSICGPFSDTLHLLSLLQVKARADGNLTEQPAVGKQKWELELTEESLHKLDLSRKCLSPDLGLSSLLPPHPSHACLPWGPQSSVLLLPITVETPASSTREGLQPQILPMPFRLYTQPPARYPLIRFKGVGVGGVSGSVTGLGILPIYCQGC